MEDDVAEGTATHDADAPAARAGKGKRRWTLTIAIVAIVLVAAVAAALFLTPLRDMLPGAGHGAAAPDGERYVEAPPMVVNMRDADGRSHFLKLRFVLVAGDGVDTAALEKQMPLIVDSLQSFLRGLRPEDLGGSAAVFRVKEEMMVRIRQVLGKDDVSDVLIQDMVEQ